MSRQCSVDEMVMAAERELKYRRQVYPRLVHQGKMTEQEAAYEISVMHAIAEHLLAEIAPKLL